MGVKVLEILSGCILRGHDVGPEYDIRVIEVSRSRTNPTAKYLIHFGDVKEESSDCSLDCCSRRRRAYNRYRIENFQSRWLELDLSKCAGTSDWSMYEQSLKTSIRLPSVNSNIPPLGKDELVESQAFNSPILIPVITLIVSMLFAFSLSYSLSVTSNYAERSRLYEDLELKSIRAWSSSCCVGITKSSRSAGRTCYACFLPTHLG